MKNHGLKKVAVIDFDVHHGNGTEYMFEKDDRVLVCSSLQHPFYRETAPNVNEIAGQIAR